MAFHTFHLYEQINHSSKYSSVGFVTVNMDQIQTMQMVDLPVDQDLGGGNLCLLKITFATHTLICEPQDYDSFHKMIDQIYN